MDIQHLRYALEVRRCGSISKAAESLFMAQPNLSSAIKELEQEINTPIFERTRSGIRVTQEGEAFLYEAEKIHAHFRNLQRIYSNQSQDSLRASITTVRSSRICARLIAYLNRPENRTKELNLRFRESTNQEVVEDVHTGRSVLGFLWANGSKLDAYCSRARSNQCEVLEIPPERYRVLLSRHHPLAQEAHLTMAQLEPYLEVLQGDFEPFRSLRAENLPDNGTWQHKQIMVYDRGSLLDCVRKLDGAYSWVFGTDPEMLQTCGLVERFCEDCHAEGREALIYKKSTLLTQELENMLAFLLEEESAAER